MHRYLNYLDGKLIEVAPIDFNPHVRKNGGLATFWPLNENNLAQATGWISVADLMNLEQATMVAAQMSAALNELHVPTDSGPHCYPRYSVTRVPQVGDLVSYSFNGDSYPDGEVVAVTKTLQVKTSGGHTYRRKRETGSWVRPGGTWSLIRGHVSERNPHV